MKNSVQSNWTHHFGHLGPYSTEEEYAEAVAKYFKTKQGEVKDYAETHSVGRTASRND